ncbi:kinase-like protein [Thelephora ganbajun]|uniref:Kinase-like protein n=1 Tax=Thelephora ganbajun TaxID=370292 RepID=A0ACB6Z5F0_THEGA|nr:kinase-like protein [Thelephora ganbajun]
MMRISLFPAGRIVREENQELTIPATPIHRLPTSAILHRIAHWDGSSQGMSQVLTTVFAAEDYLDCIRDLGKRNIDPQMYINSLDQIIDILPIYSGVRKLCIQALTETCILYQLLPTSYTFASRLSESSSTPFASGRHASVWKITNDEGAVFALRALCVYETDPVESYYKRLYTEVIIGRHVKHPNVLSVDGVAPELFRFCTVSKWMRKGDMLQYITTHPDVNRLSLLIGVTRGLEYLHGNEVVHGDLKSAGIPRLRDFGKSSWFTLRYCAPERPELGLKKQNATYESDVYSLSMVIVELATGQPPFPQVQDPEVIDSRRLENC